MFLSATLLALTPLPGPPDPPPVARYRRVIERSLERRGNSLESIDLWVDHSTWENAWEVESRHYSVRTTASRALAKNVADGLEAMFEHFGSILGSSYDPSTKVPVWIFPTLAEYNNFGDNHGAEHSSLLGAFWASGHPEQPIVCYYDPNQTLLLMWLTHAASHQYVQAAFGQTPPTFVDEGLASYFSLYWDLSYGGREHQRLRDRSYTDLEDLINEGLGNYRPDSHSRFMQLGMLFNYLLHYREETALVDDGEQPEASFADYLRALVRGDSTNGLGFEIYMELIDAVDADFRNFDFPQ